VNDADAIVIGAGPNGLVAANVLADAGWDVLVLEAQPTPGGAVRSSELVAPGFVADWCSSFYPLGFASPVLRGLELEQHGLEWVRAPLALAHPLPGGCVAVDPDDLDVTAASVDAIAPGDGDTWRRFYGRWDRAGEKVIDALLAPMPPVRPALRLVGHTRPGDLAWLARFGVISLQRGVRPFKGDGGKLLLGGNLAHSDLGPGDAGGAFLGWLLASLAQDVGFPVPRGGAQSLTTALIARLEARGGHVECATPVTRVAVDGRRATGVVTAAGATITARRAVIADTAAPSLYRDLLDRDVVPRRTRWGVRRFKWDQATVKVDWALNGPIPWTAADARRAGTVHLVDSLDDLTEFTTQLSKGLVPARPYILLGQMTTTDATRSPAGTESAWAYTHVPHDVRGDAGTGVTGRWDASDADRMADRIEGEIELRAPGFRSLIRARHVFTPPGLEEIDANLVGGAVGGGTAHLGQQLILRPFPVTWGARTPVRSLFLASAGAHPGGGVHGACGANAAHVALRKSPS
jgi:phytoene dehydrogenase-like protein